MRFIRYIYTLCILSLSVICVGGCEKENASQGGVAKLTLSAYDYNLQSSDKASVSFTLISTRDWTAVCTAPWVALSQSDGKASKEAVDVTFYVTRNDGVAREALIYFSNNMITKVVKVVQPGKQESQALQQGI